MEDGGGWERAGTAHGLSQFHGIRRDGRVWFQFEVPPTAKSVALRIDGRAIPWSGPFPGDHEWRVWLHDMARRLLR